MGKGLEARVVISAEDRTKAVFEGILRRCEAIQARAAAVGRTTAQVGATLDRAGAAMDRVGHSLGAAATRMERAAAALERASVRSERVIAAGAAASRGAAVVGQHGRGSSPGRGHGGAYLASTIVSRHGARHGLALGGYAVGGMPLAVGAVVAGEAAVHGVEAGANRQHERVRQTLAGMTPAEKAEAERRAMVLSAKYPSVDATSIMHSIRNARSIVGDFDEASVLAEDIVKMRMVAQSAKPGRDIEHETDLLLKAMEQHGDTLNPNRFRSAMARINRVLAVEGDTLGPADIYQTAQYSRQALPSASERFLYAAAPGVSQEMKGNSFGTALSSFNRAIVNGKMDAHALKTALWLGLIRPENVDFKNNQPVRVKSIADGGRGFEDKKLAASDPDFYMYKRLIPALDAKGVADPTKRDEVIGDLFSNRQAANLVDKFVQQRSRIEKNQALLANAPADPASIIRAQDPMAAWDGLKSSFDNLGAAILSSGSAIPNALNSMSGWLNEGAARLQGVKTDDARRAENRQRYGVDTDRDFSKAPVDELVEAKKKALAADAAKVAAKRLELRGVLDEIKERDADRAAGGFWGRMGFGGKETGSLVTRAQGLRDDLAQIETASARLHSLGDQYERLLAAREADPRAHLINRGGGVAVPNFNHAAFPLGSSYDHVDPSTGRSRGVPAPPDVLPTLGAGAAAQDRVARALSGNPFGALNGAGGGSIRAQLEGSVTVSSTFDVRASSNLIEIANKAQRVVSSSPLIKAGAAGGMNVGSGAPGTGTAGRTPSGR